MTKDATLKIMALREAADIIKCRQRTFICEAFRMIIGSRIGEHPLLADAAAELRSYVQQQLHPNTCLEAWLRVNAPQFPRNYETMREYRLQWLGWMIDSLEGKV